MKLDSTDRRILAILQHDAASSIQHISEKVGLSANPCWRRIKRFEAEGIITGRVAIIDPVRIGLGLTAFVKIRTAVHSAKWATDFAAAVKRLPEVIECHRLSGETDYLLKVIVSSMQHFDAVYHQLIASVHGLSDVSSAFSMELLKGGTAIDMSTVPTV